MPTKKKAPAPPAPPKAVEKKPKTVDPTKPKKKRLYVGRNRTKPENQEVYQPATTARVVFKLTCNNLDILNDVLSHMHIPSTKVEKDCNFFTVQFSKIHTVTSLSKK